MTSIILLQMHIRQQMLIIDGEEANHKVLKSSPKKWRSLTLLGLGQQRRLTQTAKVRSLKSSFHKNPIGLLLEQAIKKVDQRDLFTILSRLLGTLIPVFRRLSYQQSLVPPPSPILPNGELCTCLAGATPPSQHPNPLT